MGDSACGRCRVNREAMIAELTRDEALKLAVYDDATGKPLTRGGVCLGHPTIGIGRALDVHGISQAEALYLLNNDIESVNLRMTRELPWFATLDDVRQRVLVNMGFNMGVDGLLSFHDTLRYIADGQYDLAATAMQASAWYKQVGGRAVRLVAMMRAGTEDWNPPAEMGAA